MEWSAGRLPATPGKVLLGAASVLRLIEEAHRMPGRLENRHNPSSPAAAREPGLPQTDPPGPELA